MSAVATSPAELGITPVGPGQRALGFFDNFVLWADLGVSFLVMVVGMFLVPGLGLAQAFLAILIGATIGNLLLGGAALIGSRVGVPTMVLLRPSLGIRGSFFPTALNVLQLVGWATFEIIVMAQAANILSERLLGFSAYRLWALLFAVLTIVLAVWGPVQVVKQFMERFVVWIVLATTIWLTVSVASSYDLGALLRQPGSGELPFLAGVDLVVALPISWFPLVADYSRLSRTGQAAFWGTGLGYFVPNVWFYAIGAMLALAGGVVIDPQAPVAPLIAAIAALTAGWVALVILLVDEVDEGFANVYSAAVSAQNAFPNIRQRDLIVGIGVLVLVLSQLVPLNEYEGFLLLIGSVFVPLFGILAADYFWLRRGIYAERDLFEVQGPSWYQGGVNWIGVACWLIGLATYLAISGLGPLGVGGLAPWLGATLPSLAVSFVLYSLIGRLGARERAA